MSESSKKRRRDFCVLCAKPDEMRETISVFDQHFDEPVTDAHAFADRNYQVVGKNGRTYKILVATCTGMGHLSAAVRVAQIITRHRPEIILFIGTAASLDPAKIQIGDVVVPKGAAFRWYDKIAEKGQDDYNSRATDDFKEFFFENNVLVANVGTHDADGATQSLIAQIPLDTALAGREGAEISLGGKKIMLRKPTVHTDVGIISCGMLVDSVGYRDFLVAELRNRVDRKAGILDMESFGFFKAIEAMEDVGSGNSTIGLMIRGVSDYAGKKGQIEGMPDDWKGTSVRNASAVTAHFLRKLIGSVPRGSL